jgi:hypothetical protein
MSEVAPFSAHAWESFYVIVGSSAGALTGLQFVVITLITEGGLLRGSNESLSAFGTPNIVHFCAALLVSAILTAPWTGLAPPGIGIALAGAGGFLYSALVVRRALRQRDYKPVLEDWVWHATLPLLAYAALVVAGIQLSHDSGGALYIVGAAVLLLVFIGIHNAWDTVTYITFERARELKAAAAAARAAESPPVTPPGATLAAHTAPHTERPPTKHSS